MTNLRYFSLVILVMRFLSHTIQKLQLPLDITSELSLVQGVTTADMPSMTCHIASIAHWLPPKDVMEVDHNANENEVREARNRANREYQRVVEDDSEGRDIIWPLEQVSWLRRVLPHQLISRQSTANLPLP
jgi:hypothetical protein